MLVPTKVVVSWALAVLAEGSLEPGLQRMTKNTSIRTPPSKDSGCEKPHGAGRARQLGLGPWGSESRGVPLTGGVRRAGVKREGLHRPLV